MSTGDELLNALRSGASTIVITSKKNINLTPVLNKWKENGKIEDANTLRIGETDDGYCPSDIFINDDQDGLGLIISCAEGLTIKGKNPKKRAEIVIDPRFPDVINLFNCKNVTLENLTLGHTVQADMGWCHGNVVTLDGCENISIRNCSLFGCGVVGIDIMGTEGVTVDKTEIHHCSWDASHIDGRNITFNDCEFHHNAGFMLINVETSNVVFNNCSIRNTNGKLFGEYSIYNPITMNKCKIVHHEGLGDKMSLVKMIGCDIQVDEEGEPDGYSPLGSEKEWINEEREEY